MIDPDLWPDKATLAAGDEDKRVSRDYMNSEWPRARPYQEDGHLAADDYWKKNPDA